MEEMIIKYISRSSLTATYKGNEVAIAGESYLPGYGSPDFVAYASTLNVKTPDGVALQLLDEEKRDLLNSMVKAVSLKQYTRSGGLKPTFEQQSPSVRSMLDL